MNLPLSRWQVSRQLKKHRKGSNIFSNREGVKKSHFPDQQSSGPHGWGDWRNFRAEHLRLNYVV